LADYGFLYKLSPFDNGLLSETGELTGEVDPKNQRITSITELNVIEGAELYKCKTLRAKIPNYRCLTPNFPNFLFLAFLSG